MYNKTIWVNGVTDLNQSNMNNNESATAQVSDYVTPTSGVSTDIEITTFNADMSRIFLEIPNDITGANITINRNGGGAKNLYSDYALSENIDELLAGRYEVVEDVTGYQLISVNGGFNPMDYEPFMVLDYNIRNNVYVEILNITGEGLLKHCAISCNTGAGAGNRAYMRITKDGVILFQGTAKVTSSIDSYTGIVDVQKVTAFDSSNFPRITSTISNTLALERFNPTDQPAHVNLPYTGLGAAISFIDTPIPFEESLVVEIRVNSGTALCRTVITGEVKI